MKATIWGCRGSLATPGPATVRTGGNTSCVAVRSESGGVVILDAGTGIRLLSGALRAEGVREIDLLLTHLHLDHVEGLGFFAPLLDPACTVRIWGPRDTTSLRDRIATYLSPPLSPLPFEARSASIEFHEVESDTWQLGAVTVTSAPVCHPGPTLGYRLAEAGRSLAYIPDNEPALDRSAGVALAEGADVLLHDCQYSEDEYRTRTGWGHASIADFAGFVALTTPGRALMFHHDPDHSDDDLDAHESATRSLTGGTDVALAREGLAIEL